MIIMLLILPLSRNLAAWFIRHIGIRFFVILCYFVVVYVVYNFLQFPLAFISGFVIEHKYGFSTQHFAAWFLDWVKSLLIGLVLGGLVVEVIYFITYLAPHWWWLLLSLIMVFFNVVLVNLFPVLILPLFYKTSPITREGVADKINKLCTSAGMSVRSIESIDLSSRSTKANAAVVGLGNTKRILLGDTLLTGYSEDEIIAVLAHEITHYVEHHVWWLIVWQSMITLMLFLLFYIVHPWLYHVAGFTTVADVASFPLFILIFSVLSLLLRPIGSAISRHYERAADQGALDLVRKPAAFISVMAKFCNQQLTVAYPHPLIEWYTYAHPSPGRRIDFAEVWQEHTAEEVRKSS